MTDSEIQQRIDARKAKYVAMTPAERAKLIDDAVARRAPHHPQRPSFSGLDGDPGDVVRIPSSDKKDSHLLTVVGYAAFLTEEEREEAFVKGEKWVLGTPVAFAIDVDGNVAAIEHRIR